MSRLQNDPWGAREMVETYSVAVVDDNPRIHKFFSSEIKKFSRLAMESFFSAEEFQLYLKRLRQSDREKPCLIFLDKIMETDEAGLEVLQKLKGDRVLQKIPTIMISSSDLLGDIDKSYSCGANAYIVKPVGSAKTKDLLRDTLRFWIRRVALYNAHDIAQAQRIDDKTKSERGTTGWATKFLRQDILSAFSRDLANNAGKELDERLRSEISWIVSRIVEAFDFRSGSFGEEVVESIKKFSELVDNYVSIQGDGKDSYLYRLEIVENLKIERRNFSSSLRAWESSGVYMGDLDRIPGLLKEIFREVIVSESHVLQETTKSVRRYMQRLDDETKR